MVRRLERRRVLDASIQTMPAAVNPDGPLVVGEGTPISASAMASGPAPYTFDWSLTQGMTTLQTGTDPTFNFAVLDDANVTINLGLKDATGELSTDTFQVIVNNVPPALSLDALSPINENSSVTLTGSYTDPGVLDSHILTVNWGDPNFGVLSTFSIPAIKDANGVLLLNVGDTFNSSTDAAVLSIASVDAMTGLVGFSVQHLYLDDGLTPGNNTASDVSQIMVTVADDDQGIDSESVSLEVKNVAPTVALNTVPDVDENGIATLTGTYTDAGIFDHHTLTVDWNDPNNVADSTFAIPALKSPTGMVTLNVGDTFNSSTDSAVLTITSIDAMTGQVGFSVQHQYLDDGLAPGNNTASDLSMIGVTVADDDAQSGSDTEGVLVKNVVPTVVLNAVPDIDENGTATLTGTYTDAGIFDHHTLIVDWDDPNNSTDSTFAIPALKNTAGMATLNVGDMFSSSTDSAVLTITSINVVTGQVGFSVGHQYLDDGVAPDNNTASDLSTIGVSVADDDAQSGSDTETVLVRNVAPTVALNVVPDIDENGTATLTGSYTDIGLLDGHRLIVDWDDPNNGANSMFSIPALKNAAGMATLSVGDQFNSSTDTAVLTIASINTATGQVGFSVQHQYLDDGLAPGNNTASDSSTIAVTVADDDAQSGSDTEPVLVNNLAPTVALNAVPDIDENGTATLSGTYTDLGLLDGHTLTVDWDDPNNTADSTFSIPALKNAAGMTTLSVGDTFNSSTDLAVLTITSINAATGQVGFSVQHQYLDDGSAAAGNNTPSDISTIGVVVADDDTQSGSDTEPVLVKNVAPTVALNAVPMIDENGSATLTGSYTDVGILDAHTLTVDWDDPNNSADSTFAIPAFKNLAGMVTLNVGDTFSSSTDLAVLTIMSVNAATGQVGFSVQHQYLDDGSAALGNNTPSDISTIGVTVADDDAQSGNDTEQVLVKNVAPTVALNTVPDIDENGSATLSGTYTDVGILDTHTLTVDWGDPNNMSPSTFNIAARKDITGMVTLTVGQMFNSTTDMAVLTITSIDTVTGQVGFSVQHQYLDDGQAPGNDTLFDKSNITVNVTDDDTGSDNEMTMVTVHNVNPAFDTIAPTQMPNEGQVLDLSGMNGAIIVGSFTDVGTLDLHKAQIDWGDGTPAEAAMIVQSAGDGMIVGTHIYADNGTYTVTVRLADDDMAAYSTQDKFNSGIKDTDYVEQTFTVMVKNVAPTLLVPGEQTVDEGSQLSITNIGSVTDPGFNNPNNPLSPPNGSVETFTFFIDWGDGSTPAPPGIATIDHVGGPMDLTQASFDGSHIYADNGTYTVTVRVADDDMLANFTGSAGDTNFVEQKFIVTVKNVLPSKTDVAPANEIKEGTAFVLSNLGGTLPNMGFGLSDPGFDNPNNPLSPPGGSVETFTGDMIDWGDGSADTPVTIVMRVSGGENVLTTALFQHDAHTYADDGVYTVTVQVADDDMTGNFAGTPGVDFVNLVYTITVVNVKPAFENFVSSPLTIQESGSVNFNIGFTDPGFDNPDNPTTPATGDRFQESFMYSIDWGDGRNAVPLTAVDDSGGAVGSPSKGTFNDAHVYADDGTYTVKLTIRDDNGDIGTHEFTVTVQNVAPSFVPPVVPPGNPPVPFLGTPVTSTGFTNIRVSFSDPGFDNLNNENISRLNENFITDINHESFTHVIDWGDGTVDAVHNYLNGRIGTSPVIVSVTGPNTNISFQVTDFGFNGQAVLTLVADQDVNSDMDPQPFDFVVDWGNGTVQRFVLMLKSPTFAATSGTTTANNGQTIVVSSLRSTGDEGVPTTGSFEFQHRYTASPNPANPTADIPITATIIDDNNGSVSDFIEVPNPGISANIIAFDLTPQVPTLEFVPTRMTEIFLGQIGNTVQSLQTQDIRVARGDQNLTSDVFLELRVVFPDGSESEQGYRLPDDALQNLRAIFATLPDNRYKIYLVRTENNSRRLVMEVVVRRGRVVDPSDDSEGTRDRPPTSEQNPNAVPLQQNPLLQQVPDQGHIDPPAEGQPPTESTSENRNAVEDLEIVPVGPNVGSANSPAPSPQPPVEDSPWRTPAPRFGHTMRWSVPLVALGLTAAAGGWSKQMEAALESADRRAWQRLRRAGRIGRTIRPTPTPNPEQHDARRGYNGSCS